VDFDEVPEVVGAEVGERHDPVVTNPIDRSGSSRHGPERHRRFYLAVQFQTFSSALTRSNISVLRIDINGEPRAPSIKLEDSALPTW
jgi:hypothetical protein